MTDDRDDGLDEKAEQRSSMWAGSLEVDQDDVDEQHATRATDTEDTMDVQHTQAEQSAEDAQGAMDDSRTEWDVDSIRDAWHPNSIRLPESVQTSFNSQHKRLDWQLEQVDSDVNYTKDRYYKPLVIALGLRELQNLDAEEIAGLLEDLEHGELLE